MKPPLPLLCLLGTIGLGATAEQPNASDEFISPMLLYGLCGWFLLGIIIFVGIIFMATLAGIIHRRFSAGLRAFHYLLWAIGGLLTGICSLWLGSCFIGIQLPPFAIATIGSVVGIGIGLLLAFAFDRLARIAYQRFVAHKLPNDRNA